MKKILLMLSIPLVVGLLMFWCYRWLGQLDDPGFVLIGINGWSIETSVVFFVIVLAISFVAAYGIVRVLGWTLNSPARLKAKRKNINFNRSQQALIAGLVDAAEGNWEKAENILIKHASQSGAPLLHYLTAARAAQSRGALAKRDEYLRQATRQAPGSDIVVGLTEAELNLAENQFDRALETLTRLHSINPTHASVLKLLHQAYKKAGDWEGLRKLLPVLNEQKILMEADIKLLETEVLSMQLKEVAASGNSEQIQTLWDSIPQHIKSMPGIAAIYFAAMIDAKAAPQIEAELIQALSAKWNPTLLALFGLVDSENINQQLTIAERWLPAHPHDPLLHCILGRLYYKKGEFLQAEQYLAKSISEEPTVQAYQLLGDVHYRQQNKDQAVDCYQSALDLASRQIAQHVGQIAD